MPLSHAYTYTEAMFMLLCSNYKNYEQWWYTLVLYPHMQIIQLCTVHLLEIS